MVQQIGLSIVYKLQQELPESHRYKIDIFCRPNSHKQAEEVRKQINDKERVRAALENEDIIEFLKRLTE